MDVQIKEIEYGSADYAGLRALWCEVFGDTPAYVDSFYENFGDDIRGYAVVDGSGEVCSALTCHLCGTYRDRPVYVSYAVCTREDRRGRGFAAMLTSFVRDKVTEAGGISIVSPAEPSLISYYAELGYEPHFFAVERAVMSPEFDFDEFDDFDEYDLDIEGADPTPFRAEIDLQHMPAEKYNTYREAFLTDQPHIEPSSEMHGTDTQSGSEGAFVRHRFRDRIDDSKTFRCCRNMVQNSRTGRLPEHGMRSA